MKLFRTIVSAVIVLTASSAIAQEDHPVGSALTDVVKNVLLDPTTYAPAIVAWEATRLDWRSSQVFFQSGFVEHNPRFTASGIGDDTAIGYAAGNRQILMDSFSNLQLSQVYNSSERVVIRQLMPLF